MEKDLQIICLKEHEELTEKASKWFNEKWCIPQSAYMDSMIESQKNRVSVPNWYLVMNKGSIIAGAGVIENDFHMRKDLVPNVCAVYVEEIYRNQGIAGEMLQHICDDFLSRNIDTLYLVTEHTDFYERYDWKFLTMVQEEGDNHMTRMYCHVSK